MSKKISHRPTQADGRDQGGKKWREINWTSYECITVFFVWCWTMLKNKMLRYWFASSSISLVFGSYLYVFEWNFLSACHSVSMAKKRFQFRAWKRFHRILWSYKKNIEHWTHIHWYKFMNCQLLAYSRQYSTIVTNYLSILKYRRRTEIIYFVMNRRVLSMSLSVSCVRIVALFGIFLVGILRNVYTANGWTIKREQQQKMRGEIKWKMWFKRSEPNAGLVFGMNIKWKQFLSSNAISYTDLTEALGSGEAKSLFFISNSPMNIFYKSISQKSWWIDNNTLLNIK